MAKPTSFKKDAGEKIKDPLERAATINTALEDGTPGNFLVVLRDCVEALGGISWLSRETHLTRAAIYSILSEDGNPKYENLLRVLVPLGLRLNVAPATGRDKTVKKMKLGGESPHADAGYWLGRPVQERLAAVETLRREHYGSSARLQRIVRVIQPPQS